MNCKALVVAASLFALPALAQTAPTSLAGVNMATVLHDDFGKPIPPACFTPAVPATATEPAKPGTDCHDITIGFELSRALRYPSYPGEDKMDPAKQADMKWSRGRLADRIDAASSATVTAGSYLTFTTSEADVMKKLVGVIYQPIIVTQILEALYPNAASPAIQ